MFAEAVMGEVVAINKNSTIIHADIAWLGALP